MFFISRPSTANMPTFLTVIDDTDESVSPKPELYAALSDEQIRCKLEDSSIRVPRGASREALVALLAELEGKDVEVKQVDKSKKGGKK